MVFPQGSKIHFGEAAEDDSRFLRGFGDTQRELAAPSGIRRVLAIRVEALDSNTTSSEVEISNKVFGTSGDKINLSERFNSCSYGELQVLPFSGHTNTGFYINETSDNVGVVTVSINETVTGRNHGAIRNAAEVAAIELLGDLESQFDHVMFCLPPGTRGRWTAYAIADHWMTIYNDARCNHPSSQMHEFGKYG